MENTILCGSIHSNKAVPKFHENLQMSNVYDFHNYNQADQLVTLNFQSLLKYFKFILDYIRLQF